MSFVRQLVQPASQLALCGRVITQSEFHSLVLLYTCACQRLPIYIAFECLFENLVCDQFLCVCRYLSAFVQSRGHLPTKYFDKYSVPSHCSVVIGVQCRLTLATQSTCASLPKLNHVLHSLHISLVSLEVRQCRCFLTISPRRLLLIFRRVISVDRFHQTGLHWSCNLSHQLLVYF